MCIDCEDCGLIAQRVPECYTGTLEMYFEGNPSAETRDVIFEKAGGARLVIEFTPEMQDNTNIGIDFSAEPILSNIDFFQESAGLIKMQIYNTATGVFETIIDENNQTYPCALFRFMKDLNFSGDILTAFE